MKTYNLSCYLVYTFWYDLRRDHYLMLWILSGNRDHHRRALGQSSALKPSQIWNQIMQLRALSGGILNLQSYTATSLSNLFHCLTVPLVKEFFPTFNLNPFCSNLFQLCPLSLKNMCVHLSQWKIMEIEEEKHIEAPMLLTIALCRHYVNSLEGRPARIWPEWHQMSLQDYNGVWVDSGDTSSLKQGILQEVTQAAQGQDSSVHPCGDLLCGPPHLLAGVCWHPPGSKYGVTGAQPNHCHTYITDKSNCQLHQWALKS